MRTICLTLVLIAALSTAGSATALTWTLTGVTFGDGGTAFGSFSYDATGGAYGAVDIVTSPGSSLGGATYQFVSGGFTPSDTRVLFVTTGSADETSAEGLALFFSSQLTNSGGTVSLSLSEEATCADPACFSPAAPTRLTTAGSVTTTPEPSCIWLFWAGATLRAARRSFGSRGSEPRST